MQENPILIYKQDDNKWSLYTHKITYVENEVEQETYASDLEWYQVFEEMHDGFNIVNIAEMVYTNEQLARFEEIKNMSLSDTTINNYIINGALGDGLEMFALQKENDDLKQLLADLAELVLLGGV